MRACVFLWLNLLLDKECLAALCRGTTIVGCHLHEVNRRQRTELADERGCGEGDGGWKMEDGGWGMEVEMEMEKEMGEMKLKINHEKA